jgi:phosphohistidine phosphatase
VLIRHAKAADAPVDRDRPLAGKGKRRAAAIGSWLEAAGLLPDRVLVSPARRAAQTWDLAGEALTTDLQPVLDERIYDNTVETVLAAIGDVPDEVQTLAVVGHNPSIGELAASLDDGAGRPPALRELHAGFPTGAVAVFTVHSPLAEVELGGATLVDFAVPGA